MSQPDLDTVTARRESVKAEMTALEKMRRELEAEDEDLVVAERVLKRLAELPSVEAFSSTPSDPPAVRDNVHKLAE